MCGGRAPLPPPARGTVCVAHASNPSLPPSLQFGVPMYGASMVGEVQVAPDNSKGCKPFEKSLRAKGCGGLVAGLGGVGVGSRVPGGRA